MRWQEFIDGYDWKARLIPTAILLLPLFCTFYSFFPRLLGSSLQLAGSSLLAFALIYLASMFFRDRGVRYASNSGMNEAACHRLASGGCETHF